MENKKFKIHHPLKKPRKIIVSPPENLELLPIDSISKIWLNKGKINKRLVFEQYAAFLDALRAENVKLIEIEPSLEFRNQIFVRDTGFCGNDVVVVGRMRTRERSGEEDLMLNFLKKLNFNVLKIKKGFLEGGDVICVDEETLIVGYGNRTDEEGISEMSNYFQASIHRFQLDNRFVHLDLCMNLIDENTLLVATEIKGAVRAINEIKKFDVIYTGENEWSTLPANVLLLEKGKILAAEENRETNRTLEKLGFDVITVKLSEILKAGGGPRCLTFPLYQ